MGVALELPPELLDFIKFEPPQTLLVRGPPGTGKTMLVLELLKSFTGNGIYVSGRVSVPTLQRAFPWLGRSELPIRTVDSSRATGGVQLTHQMLQRARQMVAGSEESEEVRALWLPHPLLEEWSQITVGSPTMMVIDSWDALVERYIGPADPRGTALPDRAEIERILIDLMSRAPVFLVLVAESASSDQLDYLVNGVVTTRWQPVGARRERWLALEKLRGVRIDNPEYPFTLDGGRFTCITPSPPAYAPQPIHLAELPTPVPGRIWPGSPEFFAAFGDLPAPGLSLFELDGPVPYSAVRVIHGPIQTGVIHHGGRVVHLIPPGMPPESVVDLYRMVFSESQVAQSVRIATGTMPSAAKVPDLILPLPNPHGEPLAPRFEEAWRFMGETPANGPRLAIIWLSGMEALAHAQGFSYDPLVFPALTANIISQLGVHFLYVGESDDPLTRRLAPIASRHLRFAQRYDRTFLEGVNPQTPEFVLAEGDATSPYRLIRIV